MTDDNCAKWVDGHEISDPPEDRKSQCARNHEPYAKDTKDESSSKTLDKFWHFLKKVGLFNFLCGSTPSHVNFEEMAKKCL